jgi:thiamine-monophosphate kinase
MMRETQLIQKIRKVSGAASGSLILGIGDDAAILRPDAREDLVFTSDLLLEDRHFTREIYSPGDIGHKALARSLSDLAAMGAEPVFCLVSLGVPADLAGAWVTRFYRGLLALAKKYKLTLAGGDLARFEKIIMDVTCCGRVPRGKALLRSAAKSGDSIYVTGKLGKDWRRNRRPEPRIAAGIQLRRLGVRAAMDLSDGLSLDLQRLCVESQVGAEITANLSQEALHGGEDYELLFTAPPALKLPARAGDVPIVPIGKITSRHKGRVLLHGQPLKPKGYDHFSTGVL